MKDFGEWFNNPTRRASPPAAPTPVPTPIDFATAREAFEAGLDDLDVHVTYHVLCCCCGRRFEWPGDIAEYGPGVDAYCGGNPQCCP